MSLVREKPYDEIVVKEILNRANVGRSTFYTHFKDKDELLASGMHDLLRTIQAAEVPASGKWQEKIVRFSLPVFEHIHWHREAGAAGMGPRGRAILHGHLQKVLAGRIADDVRKALQSRRKTVGQTPPELLARYVASTFVLVLDWWVESNGALRPKDVDGLFRALTLPTLSAILE